MTKSAHKMRPNRDWQTLGITPGPVMRMSGMRRSGNHAIANWLMRNTPTGTSVFFNNCQPGKHPMEHFASLEVNGQRVGSGRAASQLPRHATVAGDGAVLLFSYEDTSTAEIKLDRDLSGSFDLGWLNQEILIYRSFLNWSASLLKKLQGNEGYSTSRRLSIVLNTVHKYTRLLGLAASHQETGAVCIRYDDWVDSDDYRADILSRLDLPLRDNGIGDVQQYGGGSSFQKQAPTANDLRVLDRWKQMRDDPEYMVLLAAAGRDGALMEQVQTHFPEDAAILARASRHSPISREDLI